MSRDRRAVDVDRQVLLTRHLFDLDIAQSALPTARPGRPPRFVEQFPQIVTEDLHGNIGPDASDHLIHTVGDRLSHDEFTPGMAARSLRTSSAISSWVRSLRSSVGCRRLNHHVALVVAGGVDRRFPAPETGHDVLDTFQLAEFPDRFHLHPDRFIQGDIGNPVHVGRDRAFLQFGNEGCSEIREQSDSAR